MQQIKFLCVAVLAITSFFLCLSTQASIITSIDNNTSFKSAYSSETLTADQFIVSSANLTPGDVYISVNTFSDFVVDEPLRIFNLPSYERPAADVIVIFAGNIALESSIEIVGPKTDVIIFEEVGQKSYSPYSGDGEVTCTGCRFLNMNRVTLGSGLSSAPSVSVVTTGNSTNIVAGGLGVLSPSATSKFIVDNLEAPGALSLELVFSSVENNGLINLNQSLSDTGVGVYNADINGSKTVGTGTVNIFLGRYKWDYGQRKIDGVDNVSGTELTLGGQISAANVRIFSTFPLTVNANIDTHTDLLATTMYRGNLTIVDENVTIETVKESTASLNLVGNINTEGSVNLNSAHDMSISSYSDINSGMKTMIVVANAFYNFGDISADITDIAAGSITNESKVYSKTRVELYAEDFIFNQYGGEVQAEKILIESESGIVRNGSKTPYKDTSPSANTLITYSENYLDEINATQLGAFYQPGVNVNTSSDSLVLAPKTNASILGNNVEILGSAFENINPYYVFTNDDGSVEIDAEKAMQVRLLANEKLMVNVGNYILNSSATIEMNSSDGELTLIAPLINNERYRIHTNLVYSNSSTTSYGGVVSETSNESLSAEIAVYSLPALMLSMGDVRIEATQSVVNNTAYMEVFGDLNIDSPTVSSLGYELGGLESTTRYTSSAWHERYNQLRDRYSKSYTLTILGRFEGSSTAGQVALDSNEVNAASSSQLDTLFFVEGDINASQAVGWFSNNLPLYEFAAARVEQLFSTYTDYCETGDVFSYEENEDEWDYRVDNKRACDETTAEEDKYYISRSHSIEIDSVTNELLVHISQDTTDALCFESNSEDCGRNDGEVIISHIDYTRSYGLFELIKDYYDSAVDWLSEVYEEIRFW